MDGETISKELIANKINPDSVVLADQCFKVSMTTNPLLQTLDDDEVDEVAFQVVQWVASFWGKINMGAALLKSVARQLTGRFPNLPTRGRAIGKDRKWRTIIFDKCRNTLYVRPRDRPVPRVPCSHPIDHSRIPLRRRSIRSRCCSTRST